jgi:hypothetical protein
MASQATGFHDGRNIAIKIDLLGKPARPVASQQR